MTRRHEVKYQLILWDFDGTLADSLPGVLRIYNGLAREHGWAAVEDPEAVRDMTMREFLRSHRIPLTKVPGLVREITSIQRSKMRQVGLHEGLAELLRRLSDRGIDMGVVSSNAEENIRACLQANGVEDCVRFVVGYSRLLGKHHALRRVLKQQSVSPQAAVYIGDEVRDVQAAQAVGVDAVAVSWGINSHRMLARYSPTWLVATPGELATLAERWLAASE